MKSPGTLLESSLAEQEARNTAALDAIRSRGVDIAVLEKLQRNMVARGYKAMPFVTTIPVGAQAACRLSIEVSIGRSELSVLLEQFQHDGVESAREFADEIGDTLVYTLKLREMPLRLRAFLTDRAPRPMTVGARAFAQKNGADHAAAAL